jgi:hypothetical protein
MPRDLLALARTVLAEFAPADDRAESAESAESRSDLDLSALLSLPAHPGVRSRRRCWTCGESAIGSWDDGSPRFDHGHDAVTGITWRRPRSRRAFVGSVRTCPACVTEHPVGTTCDGARSAESAQSPLLGDEP